LGKKRDSTGRGTGRRRGVLLGTTKQREKKKRSKNKKKKKNQPRGGQNSGRAPFLKAFRGKTPLHPEFPEVCSRKKKTKSWGFFHANVLCPRSVFAAALFFSEGDWGGIRFGFFFCLLRGGDFFEQGAFSFPSRVSPSAGHGGGGKCFGGGGTQKKKKQKSDVRDDPRFWRGPKSPRGLSRAAEKKESAGQSKRRQGGGGGPRGAPNVQRGAVPRGSHEISGEKKKPPALK